jgi:hypothetical protein
MDSASCDTGAAGPSGGTLRTSQSSKIVGRPAASAAVAVTPDHQREIGARRMKLGKTPRSHARAPLRDVVRQFTPNWFSVTMGTGAFGLTLNQIPISISWIHDLAGGLWLLDILLFGLFTVIYAAHWIFFFEEARQIVRNPVVSMFLGAIPMGLATIINGLVSFDGGPPAVWIGYRLWWVDVAMSVVCGSLVPFLMFTMQDHSMEKMTAV